MFHVFCFSGFRARPGRVTDHTGVRAFIKRGAAPRFRAACFPLLGATSGWRREGSRVGILRGENEITLGWAVNVVGWILVGGFPVYCRRL